MSETQETTEANWPKETTENSLKAVAEPVTQAYELKKEQQVESDSDSECSNNLKPRSLGDPDQDTSFCNSTASPSNGDYMDVVERLAEAEMICEMVEDIQSPEKSNSSQSHYSDAEEAPPIAKNLNMADDNPQTVICEESPVNESMVHSAENHEDSEMALDADDSQITSREEVPIDKNIKHPAYIPKNSRYYMHDPRDEPERNAQENSDRGGGHSVGRRPLRHGGVNADRWDHDKFFEGKDDCHGGSNSRGSGPATGNGSFSNGPYRGPRRMPVDSPQKSNYNNRHPQSDSKPTPYSVARNNNQQQTLRYGNDMQSPPKHQQYRNQDNAQPTGRSGHVIRSAHGNNNGYNRTIRPQQYHQDPGYQQSRSHNAEGSNNRNYTSPGGRMARQGNAANNYGYQPSFRPPHNNATERA